MSSEWISILYLIGAGLVVWFSARMIRNNPAMFSKANIGKSFFTIGILTLILIGFIALLVFLLKSQ